MADQEVVTAITQAVSLRDLDPGLFVPGNLAMKNGRTLGVVVGTDRGGNVLVQIAGIASVSVREQYAAGAVVSVGGAGDRLGVALSPSADGKVRVLLGMNGVGSMVFDPVVPAPLRPSRRPRRKRRSVPMDSLDNARVIRE